MSFCNPTSTNNKFNFCVGSDIPLNPEQIAELARELSFKVRFAGQICGCSAFDSAMILDGTPLAFTPGDMALGIDGGGSFIKAAIGTAHTSDTVKFESLAKSPHTAIPEDVHSFAFFANALFQGLNVGEIDRRAINALVIAHSNAANIISQRIGDVGALTAIIPHDISATDKNEPYMRDVKPDDNLGKFYLDAAIKAGFTGVRRLLMGNDACFLMMAEEGLHGAAVCCTGANIPVTIRGKICNAEAGKIEAPADILSQAEHSYLKQKGGVITLEELASRMGMGKVLAANILGSPEMADKFPKLVATFAANLQQYSWTTIQLLLDPEFDLTSTARQLDLDAKDILALKSVAHSVFERAAQIAGAFCYMSVCNQDPGERKVMLDASMNALGPGYVQKVQISANLFARNVPGLKIEVIHRPPNGGVSLPLEGGFRWALRRES